MLRRVLLGVTILVCAIVASSPVRALVPSQEINDAYVLTLDGKIYRLPGGFAPAQLVLDVRSVDGTFEGEWIDFDSGAQFRFLVGPGSFGSYRRVPMDFSHVGAALGIGLVGGFGGALDLYRTTSFGKSDMLLADPNPNALGNGVGNGVVRVKGDGTISLALTVKVQGFNVPKDVDVNNASGDIFVAAENTTSPIKPGAILRYSNTGSFIEQISLPDSFGAFSVVYDDRDRDRDRKDRDKEDRDKDRDRDKEDRGRDDDDRDDDRKRDDDDRDDDRERDRDRDRDRDRERDRGRDREDDDRDRDRKRDRDREDDDRDRHKDDRDRDDDGDRKRDRERDKEKRDREDDDRKRHRDRDDDDRDDDDRDDKSGDGSRYFVESSRRIAGGQVIDCRGSSAHRKIRIAERGRTTLLFRRSDLLTIIPVIGKQDGVATIEVR